MRLLFLHFSLPRHCLWNSWRFRQSGPLTAHAGRVYFWCIQFYENPVLFSPSKPLIIIKIFIFVNSKILTWKIMVVKFFATGHFYCVIKPQNRTSRNWIQRRRKMSDKILIFGKDAWPYTRAAREAFAREGREFDYYNVIKEPDHLDTMLQHSKGARKVPVIVEGEKVTIGFEGKTWGLW